MAEFEKDEYVFPDEVEVNKSGSDVEVEIEDDTPEEDRGRTPMPRPIVEELDQDELDAYDDKAKERLKQMRKVWHDERRAKEAMEREHREAIALAKSLYDENQRLNGVLSNGEQEYVATAKNAAQLELDAAKRAYKEAYEQGDSDAIVEAQEKMQLANLKAIRAHNMQVGAYQTPQNAVQSVQEKLQYAAQAPQVVEPDEKARTWHEQNPWFRKDPEMTALALGVHQKLLDEGVDPRSDYYYSTLDKTMRKRFSDYFGKTKPSSVVAPASRSTGSNKVRLTASQIAISKRLGLTPQQYANEVARLGSQ